MAKLSELFIVDDEPPVPAVNVICSFIQTVLFVASELKVILGTLLTVKSKA